MRFKQVQLFQLSKSLRFSQEFLVDKLTPLSFTPCLPSFPDSAGWIAPLDTDDAPLVIGVNGYLIMCLQIEEKIMPATVISQTVTDAIKELEVSQARKLRKKEKLSLKDEIILTMLPKAFSRRSRVYGYIDTKNHWLVLGTATPKLTERFLSLFKKSIGEEVSAIEVKDISATLTDWVKTQRYPSIFSVEKTGVLQDLNHENRVIRCQEQDLFAPSIQALLKDGCVIKQLGLSWQDRVNFVLSHDFTLRGIRYDDGIIEEIKAMEAETQKQQFAADFLIMTELLAGLLTDLTNEFGLPAAKAA